MTTFHRSPTCHELPTNFAMKASQFFSTPLSFDLLTVLIDLSQLFRLPELQLHAMACQGVGLNGGEGGNMVNPMDVSYMFPEDVVNIGFFCQVQSRCETCNCLVPDLVFDEHRQTCWAKSDTKKVISFALKQYQPKCISITLSQRIATPMENRKRKYGADAAKFSTVPKK